MKTLLKTSIGAAALWCVATLVSTAWAAQVVITPNGTWTAYPGQSISYEAAIQQPINNDGSSSFRANGHAVIPIKFALSQGTGAFVFESIFSDNPGVTANDYSYLKFSPNTAPTLADIIQLIAVYHFTEGDCQTGSLRWTLYLNDNGTTRNLDIHYQPGAGGIGQQTCAEGTSGHNMADQESTDPYVVIQEFTHAPYSFSSSYNVTYSEAVSQLGSLQVLGMNLIVDSGDGVNGDQIVALTSATVEVGGSTSYIDTFTPQETSPTPVCPTQQAFIGITKLGASPSGEEFEPISIQPNDTDGIFRIVDCKYMYNMATSSLMGAGDYHVVAHINGTTFDVADFSLR